MLFLVQKYKYYTDAEAGAGTRFGCFNSAKVQILTQKLAQTLKKLNALKAASVESEKNSRIARVTLNVIEGEWSIGPANRRLACVSLKGMTHKQINDIELGVPMEHKFVLKFFQIESLLSDVWNLEFNKVLGPQDCDGQFVSAGDIDAETDYAMLCLVLHQLPKPEGNQVVFSSMSLEIYPLRIQITEDLYNCLYAFAFPGKWEMEDGRSVWQHDSFHNISVLDPAVGKMVTVEQNRCFFRLPLNSCRPQLKSGTEGSAIDASSSSSSRSARQPLDAPPTTTISSSSNSRQAVPTSASSDAVEGADKSLRPRATTSGAQVAQVLVQKETRQVEELEELKLRARDHVEFQKVRTSASPPLLRYTRRNLS